MTARFGQSYHLLIYYAINYAFEKIFFALCKMRNYPTEAPGTTSAEGEITVSLPSGLTAERIIP